MPAAALQALLADLNKDFASSEPPKDVLQFCADWFQEKLRQERSVSQAGKLANSANATPRKFPNFPTMPSPAQPNTVSMGGAHPSPFSEHGPADSPFGAGSALAQRRATLAAASDFSAAPSSQLQPLQQPSFGNGPAPNATTGSTKQPQLSQLSEEEEGPTSVGGGADTTTPTPAAAPQFPPAQPAPSNLFGSFSFDGGVPQIARPEESPSHEGLNEDPFNTTASNTSRAPPPASSSGLAHATADELVPPAYALGRRTSVSAESLIPKNAQAPKIPGANANDETTPTIPSHQFETKSPSQLERIKTSISKNFLFRNLDEDQERDVLNAMREIAVKTGDVIIEQGADGDFFYVVESGEFDIYVKKPDAPVASDDQMEYKWGKRVFTAKPGGSFGELALMYNAPRNASVIAKTDGTLWALDRISFRTILLDHTSRKRRMYETFLSTVPILSTLEPHERAKIADALESRVYQPGDIVVQEGDPGNEFYLIESGVAVVEKRGSGQVGELSKGDYFGELALINQAPRAATVRASQAPDGGKLRVAALGAEAFTRLLGPVREIMARKAGEYRS